jgi:hypothetical protein
LERALVLIIKTAPASVPAIHEAAAKGTGVDEKRCLNSEITKQNYKTYKIPYHISIATYLNILSNMIMISCKYDRDGIQSKDNGMYQFNHRTNNLLRFTDDRRMVCSNLLLLPLPVITSDTFSNRLLLAGDVESNPGPTYYHEDDRHFPAIGNDNSSMDLQIKLNFIIYKMKCARSKKRFQDSNVKSASAVTSKFNGSKVTLMKFRNSLFLNGRSFDKRQRYQFVKCPKLSVSYSCNNENLNISGVSFSSEGRKKCFSLTSLKSEFDDYSRIETEQISYILPWSIPNKSKIDCSTGNYCWDTDPNKLSKSGDVESNPGPTPMNNVAKSPGRPNKKAFPSKTGKSPAICIENQSTPPINVACTSFTPSSMLRSNPIGLLNTGENICFLNCVVQVLYFLPALHNRLYEYNSQLLIKPLTYDQHMRDNVMISLKSLFDDISNSFNPVRSSKYFDNLL